MRAGHARPLQGGERKIVGRRPRRAAEGSRPLPTVWGETGWQSSNGWLWKACGPGMPGPYGGGGKKRVGRHQLPASLPLTQSLHKCYMFPLDVTGWMVYTVGRRAVLSYYILCQFSIGYLIFMKGAFPMLPCQKNCHAYCPGCHKSCPHFRAMQEQQHRDLIRKKEYLRRADESCRAVLHQCRAAGGYLGPLPY